VNNGTTWEPIFDSYPTSSIGDIAIYQADPTIVWVGTGEANNRQSSSFGDGIYKSTDGGKTFRYMGLKDTQTIARIVVDLKDSNLDNIPAGQFYGVAADMRRPHFVYEGLQDNGSWGGPSATRSMNGPINADWFRVGSGDGVYVVKMTVGGKEYTTKVKVEEDSWK
jgi:hypothetical protein